MKKLGIILWAFASVASLGFARSLNVDPNQSGQLLISGTGATQIFTNDSAATRSYVINQSTCNVFLVGYSTSSAVAYSTGTFSISTSTGSFLLNSYISGGTTVQALLFSLDGPRDIFTGPLWGQSACSTGNTISRFRTH